MPRIEFIGIGIQKVIVNHHFVPSRYEVVRDIKPVLEIAIHSQESRESPVYGIVKGNGIKAIIWCIP